MRMELRVFTWPPRAGARKVEKKSLFFPLTLTSILSNSSMQQTAPLASSRAPASMHSSPGSASRTTDAVRPAAEEARPDV